VAEVLLVIDLLGQSFQLFNDCIGSAGRGIGVPGGLVSCRGWV
jgi:hypothetical protein